MSALPRFLVFGGERFYASGGWNDHLGSADTVQDAQKIADEFIASERAYNPWWHIVDSFKDEIIIGSKNEAHS